MHISAQQRTKAAQKRAIQRAIHHHEDMPNGAHPKRRENVRGKAGHRRILRRKLKGSDRRMTHMQLHDACRGNLDVEVTGKNLRPNLTSFTARLTS